jgi:membrane-bound lytic murein transglycosylase MltF
MRWSNRPASRSRAGSFRNSRGLQRGQAGRLCLARVRWAVDKERILAAAKPFFERIPQGRDLKRLVDRYYGHTACASPRLDSETLLERIGTQLPTLKPFFEEASA